MTTILGHLGAASHDAHHLEHGDLAMVLDALLYAVKKLRRGEDDGALAKLREVARPILRPRAGRRGDHAPLLTSHLAHDLAQLSLVASPRSIDGVSSTLRGRLPRPVVIDPKSTAAARRKVRAARKTWRATAAGSEWTMQLVAEAWRTGDAAVIARAVAERLRRHGPGLLGRPAPDDLDARVQMAIEKQRRRTASSEQQTENFVRAIARAYGLPKDPALSFARASSKVTLFRRVSPS